MLPHDERNPFVQNPWKRFLNGSGESIPPFAVMRITGATNNYGEITITVAKPNSTEYEFYVVNGPFEVPAGDEGVCTTLAQAGYVAYNSGSGTPALAETWGPKSGQWTVEKNHPGFWIVGGTKTTAGVTAVVAIQNAGSQGLVRFELTATLTLSGDAAAILLEDDGADWADTADAIQVYDLHTTEGMWAGISGYRGWAVRIQGSHASGRPRYGIVWMEQIAATIEFTTTEYMGASTAGRLTACSVDWYDHQGKNPGSTVDVRDPQGKFPDVPSGAKGQAVYDYHNSYYRITNCQRVALFASALLNGASCASAMTIDNFAIKETGDYCLAPPTTPTTPTNTCGHAGLDNDTVLLRRTNNTLPNPSWEVIDVSLHLVKPITTVEISGGNLQFKTKDTYVELCSTAESSPTTIAGTTTSCP